MKPLIEGKFEKVEYEDLKLEWSGYSFFFSGDNVPVNPKVKIEYRGFKKNGDPKANLTKDEVTIIGRYCPFCGRDTK